MLGSLIEEKRGELEYERSLDGEQVPKEVRGLVAAQSMKQHTQDGRQQPGGSVVRLRHHLDDGLQGVEDDHARLCRQQPIEVSLSLWVDDALAGASQAVVVIVAAQRV